MNANQKRVLADLDTAVFNGSNLSKIVAVQDVETCIEKEAERIIHLLNISCAILQQTLDNDADGYNWRWNVGKAVDNLTDLIKSLEG